MQLKTLNKEEIKKILASGNFSTLTGTVETQLIDCKQKGYELSLDRGKFELAKDVSAFANVNGGLILLGVETKKSQKSKLDIVSRPRIMPEETCDRDQYLSIVNDWIYPPPQRVEFTFHKANDDPKKGIYLIDIPNQDEYLKPFLISKTLFDDDNSSGFAFGHAERSTDRNSTKDVKWLHENIRAGMSYGEILKRLENLEALVAGSAYGEIFKRLENIETLVAGSAAEAIGEPKTEGNNKDDIVRERVTEAIIAASLQQKPTYALAAYTKHSLNIPNFFRSREERCVKLLTKPPKIRRAGFDIQVFGRPEIIGGELWRVANPEHNELIELWKDGTLIFVTSGGRNYLRWPRETGPIHRINPVVLIESIFLFSMLYKELLDNIKISSNDIKMMVVFQNMITDGRLPYLQPSLTKNADTSHTAPYSDGCIIVSLGKVFKEAGLAAYKLVTKTYEWFGVPHDEIPLTKIVGDEFEIDPEAIKRLRG